MALIKTPYQFDPDIKIVEIGAITKELTIYVWGGTYRDYVILDKDRYTYADSSDPAKILFHSHKDRRLLTVVLENFLGELVYD